MAMSVSDQELFEECRFAVGIQFLIQNMEGTGQCGFPDQRRPGIIFGPPTEFPVVDFALALRGETEILQT